MTDEQQAELWYENWRAAMFPDGGGRTWRELPLESQNGYLLAARIKRTTDRIIAELKKQSGRQAAQ